jgi:Xaa-Pro aminopeptidase
MGVVSKPTPRQRDLYNTLRDVYMKTIDHMRAGVTGGEVFDFAKRLYLERGVDFAWRPHIGHSMAQIRGHDDPMIQPFDRNPLEPGMTIALEPSFRSERERYHIEDLVLITDGAPKILSNWWNTEQIFTFE